jgi:ribosomal-protein-alanine N-acetyltransferase
MSSIVIRRGLPSDLAAMYALDLACFEPPFVFSRQAMRRFALQANAIVLVAESGQAMAGFVIVHVERRGALTAAYVTTLDVAAKHRRAGLARRLMQMAEGAAADAGAGHVWLHVFTENAAAIRFNETCGYTREVHVPGFYGAGRSAYVYGKELKVPDRGDASDAPNDSESLR